MSSVEPGVLVIPKKRGQFGLLDRQDTRANDIRESATKETTATSVSLHGGPKQISIAMRRASFAPSPAGGDGGAAATTTSRLAMPQMLPLTTRPPLPDKSATVGAVATNDGPGTDSDVPPSPAIATQGPRTEGSVQVAVRVRPLLPKEIASNVRTCVRSDGNMVHIPASERTFTFDHVFPVEATQKDLYVQVVQPLMDSFLQGFNVTVIAYGQTGSGKTYTMGNDSSTVSLMPGLFQQPSQLERTNSDILDVAGVEAVGAQEGVIPRFLHDMFTRLRDDKTASSSHVSVSFLEIYGEDIHDLLDRQVAVTKEYRDNLQVRESHGSVWVQGLTEVKVSSSAEAAEQMRLGCLQRITASTGMNEHSSRSHAIYTVKIIRKMKTSDSSKIAAGATEIAQPAKRRGGRKLSFLSHEYLGDDDGETTIVSKLTFVDLAGSERLKKTQAEGDRMKEGIQINVGLLALGNVITALGDERRRSNPRQHVSYRDSKLTRLLQDALGGNSRTLFIACVSPVELNVSETINTLQYASRAKNIQNKAVKNVDSRTAELGRMKSLVEIFRQELIRARFLQPGVNFETLLRDPTVIEYLRVLEEMASTNGNPLALNFEFPNQIAVPRVPLSAGSQCSSCSSKGTNMGSGSGSSIAMMDGVASGGSSIHMMNDAPDFRLQSFFKVLEIIRLNLEMKELMQKLSDGTVASNTKIAKLDAQLALKNAVLCALQDTLSKMGTWSSDESSGVDRGQQFSQATGRLESVRSDIDGLVKERLIQERRLDTYSVAVRKEMKQKQDKIRQVRQSHGAETTIYPKNPIDLILQVAEIKFRFGLRELSDVAWALETEEKLHAEFLDDERDSLAFTPAFFSRETCANASTVFNQIYQALESAIADEDLEVAHSARLRERADIVQRIMIGWEGASSALTEVEFMAANEQQIRVCEENIRELSEALRYRRNPSSSISYAIDAIDSLDVAKSLSKRLVESLYGNRRLYLAQLHGDDGSTASSHVPSPSNGPVVVPVDDVNMEKDNEMTEKFDKEMVAILDMVRPYSLGALSQANESFLAQRCADIERKYALLEQDLTVKNAAIAQAESENVTLRNSLEVSNAMMQTFKGQAEAVKVMERYQQMVQRLGLSGEDEADTLKDVNGLLVEKYTERIEAMETARVQIQERIEAAYNDVKRLEVILQVDEPVDLLLLQRTPGKTLMDEEREMVSLRTKLEDELLQRIDSRTRGLESIHGLVSELGIATVDDFRHAADDISSSDVSNTLEELPALFVWKQIQTSPNALRAFIESAHLGGDTVAMMSEESLNQGSRFLKALFKEKAQRLTEMEDLMNEIRSLIQQLELTQDEVHAMLMESHKIGDEDPTDHQEEDLVLCITRKAGQLVISNHGLSRLALTRDTFVDVRDGRTNAISYLYSILEEAAKITHDLFANSSLQGHLSTAQVVNNNSNQETHMKEYGCCRDALSIGVDKLAHLPDPIDRAMRVLLYTMSDQLSAFGIESDTQRVSFFLGCGDHTADSANRIILEKYIAGDKFDSRVDSSECGGQPLNSFLSELDPVYSEFAGCYSASYGTKQLQALKESAEEVVVVNNLIQSAHKRLESLQTIMAKFNVVNALRKQIEEFRARASDPGRLRGSSKPLLDEEKRRKQLAKEYQEAQSLLRQEIDKWRKNEGGEYDLNILGQEMKTLLIEMVNANTNLMHLDLGYVDQSRPSARRQSKTAAGIASVAAAAALAQDPSPTKRKTITSTLPRARPGSALARDTSTKKRMVADP